MLAGVWLSDKTQNQRMDWLGASVSQWLLQWAGHNLEQAMRNTGKKPTTYKVCLTWLEENPISFRFLSLTVVKIGA